MSKRFASEQLLVSFTPHVEALCAKTREEKFAFESLSYMDLQIGDLSDAIPKVCSASTQILGVNNHLIRVIFLSYHIRYCNSAETKSH